MERNAMLVARQYRLQMWAGEIESCQQRPVGMTVKAWCQQNGINSKSYYYHVKQVREARLKQPSEETAIQNVVAVPANLLQEERQPETLNDSGLELSYGRYRVRVPEGTSSKLLRMVLEVTTNVE